MKPSRLAAWTAARLLLASFCWMTAAYAWVASSTFALLQFLQPRVFPWVGQFSDWHAVAAWGWLAIAVGVGWHDVRHRDTAAGRLALSWLALCAVAVAWNAFHPVLPRLTGGTGGPASIVTGVLALAPIIYAAAIDHVVAWPSLSRHATETLAPATAGAESRVFLAAVSSALFVTALYAAFASAGMAGAFEPDLLTAGLSLGLGWSLLDHLWIACAAFLAVAAIGRLAQGRPRLQYGLLFALLTAAIAVAFRALVGVSLGMQGGAGALTAGAFGLSLVGTWSGLRLRHLAAGNGALTSPLDAFFGTPLLDTTAGAALIRLLAAAAFSYTCFAVARAVDWDFVLLKAGVLAAWISAFAVIYRLTPTRVRPPGWIMALVSLVPVAAQQTITANADQTRTLGRYEVYNPSFRLTRNLLHHVAATPSFDRFLRDNTNLGVVVPPADLDFVSPLTPRPQPPPVFLFVVDSLRPDYLGSYNRAVRFTPQLDAFAAESVVFRNTFTRFGGTGLSLPAIWAGSALVHKQYVLPFQPMNTLEKLLDANGYRQLLDLDSIMRQLVPRSERIDTLDPGTPPATHELCSALTQIESRLAAADATTPIFGYSLPQDVHMSRLPLTVETGPDYQSFHAPYATKVHAIDVCFGRFIDALKTRGLYDQSLIVLTADHGEMLGEDGQFGHSTHLLPQVIQVPLIVHLPSRLARPVSLDVDAVSLTTDITPTIYAALGYLPVQANPLMGRSLLNVDDRASSDRRREPVVIASSYGAVYAVLRRNGRRLYIADGIAGRDAAYEREPGAPWRQLEVSTERRSIDQFAIRRYVDEVSRTFHVPDRR